MKILLCYDGSNNSKNAAKMALKMAEKFQSEVHVVASHEDESPEVIRGVEEELEYACSLFREKGLECKTHLLIRGLTPGEDLVKFANENNIELIVIGVRERSRVDKLVFGSTPQHVILKASCPVLTVK